MRIIVNSDVFFIQKAPREGLSWRTQSFCQRVSTLSAVLVLVRPALLELRKQAREAEAQLAKDIRNAAFRLEKSGVVLPPIAAEELARGPDVPELLRATGVQVEVLDPVLQDYRSAEERACLHLSPHPPDIKSDEMRDLVIWEVALRIARRDGSAILLSRDEVHSHQRGEAEALQAGLLRAKDADTAVALLGGASPAATLAQTYLQLVWKDLSESGLPVPPSIEDVFVEAPTFSTDRMGYVGATFVIRSKSSSGAFSSRINLTQVEKGSVLVVLTDAEKGGNPLPVPQSPLRVAADLKSVSPNPGALEELRTLLGNRE